MKLDLSRFIRNNPVLADADKQKERGRNYLVSAFVGAIFVAIVLAIWPDTLPFTYFQFWTPKGAVLDWLRTSWPIFAWGVGVTTIASIITRNKPEENRNAEGNLAKGFVVSAWAGVMEEICFRWLIFMSSIIGVKIVNFLFFGFAGLGIAEWLQVHLLGPIANFFTIGIISGVIGSLFTWGIGAGLLGANGFFRDRQSCRGA